MNRRAFIGLLGGATAWPLVAQAQQPRMHRLAFVHSGIPADKLTAAAGPLWVRRFFETLEGLGHREGGNLVVQRFSARGDTARYTSVAAEVAAGAPDVVVSNSNPLVAALIRAGPTIPIVAIMGDPVAAGLVPSLARPGGSLTGVSIDGGPGIASKRLQILTEAVPGAGRIVYLVTAGTEERRANIAIALKILPDVSETQLRRTFADLADEKAEAVVVSEDGSYLAMRSLIVALAAQHRIAAMYAYREFAEAGGLLAYGPELGDLAKRMADDVHLILGGTKPGDIPILQPKTFELIVNLKTAKAMGLTIPPSLLAQADEVIE